MRNLFISMRSLINFIKSRFLRYVGAILLTLFILLLISPCISALLSIFQIGFPESNRFLEIFLYTIGYGSDLTREQVPPIMLYILALIGVFIISVLTAYITTISFKRTKNVVVSKDVIIEENENDKNKYICIRIENTGSEIYDLDIALMWHIKVKNSNTMEEAHKIDEPKKYAALPKKTKVTVKFRIDDLNTILLKKTTNDSIFLVSYISYTDNFFGQRYSVKKEHEMAGNNRIRQNTDNKNPINLFDAIPINAEAITLYKDKKASLHADIHFNKKHLPPFTMALLLFEEPYLIWENYHVFEFLIKGKGLDQIKLEVKSKDKKILISKIVKITDKFELEQLHIYEYINFYNKKSFREINEICFTVFPDFLNNAKLQGEFTIEDCKMIQMEEMKDAQEQIAITSVLPSFSLLDAKPINEEGIDLHITENDTLYASVNLNENQSPSYTMALLLFEEPYLNLEDYYVSNYVFEVMIRGEGLSKIRLEIKDKNKRLIIDEIVKLTDEFESSQFTLSDYQNKESFREINEICFTVYPEFFENMKKKKGEFEIKHCMLLLPCKQV
jgi:hypothetical protein